MSNTVLGELLAELQQAVSSSPDEARLLAPASYRSQEFFDLEIKRIFETEWVCVGRTDHLENPGDFFTTTFLDEPLVVVRQDDGRIATFTNVCRHRYHTVAEGAGHASVFVCPYHKWTYNTDGSLRGAPGMERSTIARSACRLPEIRMEVWNRFVFVNLDSNAAPLKPRLASLDERLANYGIDEWAVSAIDDTRWQGNWKLGFENAIESYHHLGLHLDSLNAIMPALGTEFVCDDGTWGFHRTPYSEAYAHQTELVVPELAKALGPDDAGALNVFWIYPSFVLPMTPTFGNFLSFMPLSVGETRVYTGLCAPDEARITSSASDDGFNQQAQASLEHINSEDRAGAEKIQRASRSRFAGRGPMSTLELGVLYFHRYLAGKLAA